MTTGGSLDLIGDEIPRLEGVRHATRAHTDAVADSDGAKLVPNHASIHDGLFYTLTETKQMTVASAPLNVYQGDSRMGYFGEEGAYGFPSYLVDLHENKGTLEWEN